MGSNQNIAALFEQFNRNTDPIKAKNTIQTLLTEHINDVKSEALPDKDKVLIERMLKNVVDKSISESAIGAGAMQNVINFMLPVVRKLMPNLIARNLLPTYPLDMPEARIRFLRYFRGDGREPFKNTGVVLPEHYNAYSDPDVYAFNHVYASSDLIDYLAAPAAATYSAATVIGNAYVDFHVTYPDSDLLWVHPQNSDKQATLYKFKVSDPAGNVYILDPANFDFRVDSGTGLFTWETNSTFTGITVDDGAGTTETITNIVVTIDQVASSATFGQVTLTMTGNAAVPVNVSFYMTVYFSQELQSGSSIDLRFEYYNLKTEVRKLKATITTEALMLASQGHKIDINNELVETLAMLTSFEVDRWIIGELYNAAITRSPVTQRTFVAKLPDEWVTGPQQYYSFLIDHINRQSAEIYRRSLRGPAKWIVTSPEVYALLILTGQVSGINSYEKDTAGQLEAGGKLSHKYDIYVDPYFGNRMLLGYNTTDGSLNTGAVFAPFVPLALLPPDYRSVNTTFNFGLYTQAAVTVIDPSCYGVIEVSAL